MFYIDFNIFRGKFGARRRQYNLLNTGSLVGNPGAKFFVQRIFICAHKKLHQILRAHNAEIRNPPWRNEHSFGKAMLTIFFVFA